MSEKRRKDKSANWRVAGWLLTAVYFAGTVWVTSIATPEGFIKPNFGLELNTLGDFLAGVFAPVAFLWLFIAVMIQSEELAEQRRELELTRDVSIQLAKEAKAQAEYLGVQTDLLKAEREENAGREKDREFFDRLEAIKDFVNEGQFSISKRPHAQRKVGDASKDEVINVVIPERQNGLPALKALAESLESAKHWTKDIGAAEKYTLMKGDMYAFERLSQELTLLSEISASATPGLRYKVSFIPLQAAITSSSALMNKIDARGL